MRHINGIELLALRGHLFDECHIFIALVVRALGELAIEFLYLALHLAQMGEGLRGFFKHGAPVFGHQVLREIGHNGALRSRDGAACGLAHTSENLEERALARAVLAHEGDAVFLVDDEGYITEKGSAGKLYGQVVCG